MKDYLDKLNRRANSFANPLRQSLRGNPVAVGGAAAGAALFGAATSNEGRGPLESAAAFAPIGAGVGASAMAAYKYSKASDLTGMGKEAWQFLGRAPSDWSGPAAQSWASELSERSKANPFIRAAGGYPAIEVPNVTARAPKMPIADVRAKISEILDPAREIPTDPITGTEAAPDIVAARRRYAKMAGLQASSDPTKFNPFSGKTPLDVFNKAVDEMNLTDIATRANTDEDFARQFLRSYQAFESGGITDFAPSMPAGAIMTNDFKITHSGREGVMGHLKRIGREDLIRELNQLDSNIDLAIKSAGEGGAVLQIGKTNVPLVRRGAAGLSTTVSAGAIGREAAAGSLGPGLTRIGPGGGYDPQSVYLARRQVWAGSLANNVRPEVLELDTYIARLYSRFHHQNPNAVNQYADELLESALMWDRDHHRPDRGLGEMARNRAIRRMEAQLMTPKQREMRALMGIGEDMIDYSTGTVKAHAIAERMAQYGYAQYGSSGGAKKGIFYRTRDLARLGLKHYFEPVNKAVSFIRDYSKPYWVSSTAAGLERLMTPAFMTPAFKTLMGGTPGLTMNVQALFESEVAYLSKQFIGPDEAGAMRLLEQAGVAPGSRQKAYRALQQVSEIREGVMATAMPEGFEFSQKAVKRKITRLNPRMMEMNVGDRILPDMALGYDETGKAVYHTFSKKNVGGYATLAAKPVQNAAGEFAVELIESAPAAGAKIGSDIGKMLTTNIDPSEMPLVKQVVNYMRQSTDPRLRKLYGGQGFVSLLSNQAVNAIPALTLAESFGKQQGSMELLLGQFSRIYLPQAEMSGNVQGLERLRSELQGMGLRVHRRMMEGSNAPVYTLMPHHKQMRGAKAETYAQTLRQKLMGGSGSLIDRVVADPQYFGLSADTFAGSGSASAPVRALMSQGAVTLGNIWDAPYLNQWQGIPFTYETYDFMRRYGAKSSATELLGRRVLRGDEAQTASFYRLWNEYGNQAAFSNASAKDMQKMGVATMALVEGAGQEGTLIGTNKGYSSWRGISKYKKNFVLDLMAADSILSEGELKATLGTSKIPVPGTATDLWYHTFVVDGKAVQPEQFAKHLDKAARLIRQAHTAKTPEEARAILGKARPEIIKYWDAVHKQQRRLQMGKESAVKLGAGSFEGMITPRDYASRLKRMAPTNEVLQGLSGHVIGVTPQQYQQLAKTGAQTLDIGGTKALVGFSERFPQTSVDPMVVISDPSLKYGQVGMDEYLRAIKEADYDADRLIGHIMKGEGAVQEVGGLLGVGPAAGSMAAERGFYQNTIRMRRLLDKFETDIATRMNMPEMQLDLADKLTKRMGVDQKPFKQAGKLTRDAGELGAKMSELLIGHYSNLARDLEFMARGVGATPDQRGMRSLLGSMIKQTSIDFARHMAASGGDPFQMVNEMRSVLVAAESSPSDAGQMLAKNLKQMGFIETARANLDALEGMYDVGSEEASFIQRTRNTLNEISENWFAGVTGEEVRRRRQALGAMSKHLPAALNIDEAASMDEAAQLMQQAMGEMEEMSNARAAIASEAPVAGRSMSKDQLSGINRRIKQVGAMKGGAQRMFSEFMGSGGLKPLAVGGAIGVGAMALLGAIQSPVTMESPGAAPGQYFTPDAAHIGRNQGAPMPGGRGGNAGESGQFKAPIRSYPASPSVQRVPRRMYVEQTNRTPQIRHFASGDPYDANLAAADISNQVQQLYGGNAQVNIVHDPGNRRASQVELEDRVRDQLTGIS